MTIPRKGDLVLHAPTNHHFIVIRRTSPDKGVTVFLHDGNEAYPAQECTPALNDLLAPSENIAVGDRVRDVRSNHRATVQKAEDGFCFVEGDYLFGWVPSRYLEPCSELDANDWICDATLLDANSMKTLNSIKEIVIAGDDSVDALAGLENGHRRQLWDSLTETDRAELVRLGRAAK